MRANLNICIDLDSNLFTAHETGVSEQRFFSKRRIVCDRNAHAAHTHATRGAGRLFIGFEQCE